MYKNSLLYPLNVLVHIMYGTYIDEKETTLPNVVSEVFK